MTIPNDGQKPLVTIITICYQAKEYIQETIESVISQTYPLKEYIVVDGGSTDGTLDIIMRYRNHMACVISERDKGIYDAMNKGIHKAHGEWICFMNAGDKFFSEKAIENMFKAEGLDKVDILYGDVLLDYGDFFVLQKANPDPHQLWKGMIFSHQSVFIKTTLCQRLLFDIRFRIAADFDFFYRAFFVFHSSFAYRENIVSIVDVEGVSNKKQAASVLEWWKVVRVRDNLSSGLVYRIHFYYFFRFLFSFLIDMGKNLVPSVVWQKLVYFWKRRKIFSKKA